jgi:hypothetical protein
MGRKNSPGHPCCTGCDDCIADCPTHVAEASYSATVGSHTATLVSPEANCNFIGSSCIVDATTVTNSWTDTTYESHTFSDIYTCSCDTNCCNGSQVPGEERAPATTQLVQTAYTRRDKWIRWEQLRESMTIQLYDAGSGNLRILVTVLKEILYLVGVNTVVRGGYRVATITYCTPAYTNLIPEEDPPDPIITLPEIPCSISYAAPVWDAWPTLSDPGYPPCHEAPIHASCAFAIGTATTTVTTLELETIGPFDYSTCISAVCTSGTFYASKVKSRLYTQNCAGGFVYGGIFDHDCFGVEPFGQENYRAFGYYYYYSDPFPCDAFPANPIALKREPYTDIAATTTNETECGQTFPYRTPAVSKDLTITIT